MDGHSQAEDLKKAIELIEDIRVAGLITHSDQEGLKGRPMGTAKVEEDGTLWFFTNEYSAKVSEISKNDEVFLSYTSMSANSYVMIKGSAELNDDRDKMEEFWNPAMKAWFPDGLDDPKLFLLKVKPDHIEFWDAASSKIVFAFKMAKAILKGEQYKGGENKEIDL